MQLVRHRLVPPELDHELIWLTVSFGSLAFAAIWLAFGLPWPRCAFHDVTGLPCVTCGMTRSAIQFFHGNFLLALRWNPIVFVALCGLSIFDAYAFVVLVARAPRLRIAKFSSAEKTFVRALVVTSLGANWGYLLLHWRNFY
jgi:Protein of unknown function (DUF2752)